MDELKSMIPRTSQYHPGHEIPEKNLYYRIAKKFLFNDFGVYNGHDHTKTAAPYIVKETDEATRTSLPLADAGGCCGGGGTEPTGCCNEPDVVSLGSPDGKPSG